MRITRIFCILIGYVITIFSLKSSEKRMSCCVESFRAKDGEHGIPGHLEDGENGQDGENGKNGRGGGHGGNGEDAV